MIEQDLGAGDASRPYEVLHESKNNAEIEVQGRTLKLSNRGKVLYPETGFTKEQLVDYYAAVGPVLLSHLEGRPLTLKRYPDGVQGKHFYEKRCPSHRRQNDQHKTTICVYSLRARERPTISTPLTWEEVQKVSVTRKGNLNLSAEPEELLRRIDEHGDLFAPLQSLTQTLPELAL